MHVLPFVFTDTTAGAADIQAEGEGKITHRAQTPEYPETLRVDLVTRVSR